MTRTIGVDVGNNGAIALVVDGVLESVVDMPVVEIKRGRTTKRQVSAQALSKYNTDNCKLKFKSIVLFIVSLIVASIVSFIVKFIVSFAISSAGRLRLAE